MPQALADDPPSAAGSKPTPITFPTHLSGNQSLARHVANGRFDLTFTPKHGSWLNLIEGFFSKFARLAASIPSDIKHELKERMMAGIDDVNRHPVVQTWSYRLAEAAENDSTMETLN